ncbi:MAG: glycosyltransferase family 2 protein [Xanthobacteraceae bacterium]
MKETLGLVCVVKNESSYILEWVAHYRTIGIKNLILYDNDSNDGTGEILEKLARRGVVQVLNWPVPEGTSPQLSAYADALGRFRDRFDFLAFFDADEFLTPRAEVNITNWISSLDDDVGAVAINQRVFGSSGQKTRQSGLVIDRFRRASNEGYDENRWVKSIYRATSVAEIRGPHRGILSSGRYILPNGADAFGPDDPSGKALGIDFSLFQLNHYIIKSEEEFLVKRARGGGMGATAAHRLKRYEDLNFFHGRDAYINASLDEILAARIPLVESEILSLADMIDVAKYKSLSLQTAS